MFSSRSRFLATPLRLLRLSSSSSATRSRSASSSATLARVERVLAAKAAEGLSYDALAEQLGVTNTYAAQLLLGQAKLTAETAPKLRQALPALTDDDLQEMQATFPMRSFDDAILKEPHVYRTYEAVTHYGEAIKRIINEQCGDGIMSAIDFYADVGVSAVVACAYSWRL